MIPTVRDKIGRDCADEQIRMFSMFVGKGLFVSRAALVAASGIPDSTLKGWAAGAAIPYPDVLVLRKFLPAEAINMLTGPGEAILVDVVPEEANWDEVASEAADLVSDVCEARRDGKINHQEDARLRRRTRDFISKAQHMVEGG